MTSSVCTWHSNAPRPSHHVAAQAVLRRSQGQAVLRLDDLAVDQDAPADGVDAVGAEAGVLAPAQPCVRDEQDLKFSPPHVGVSPGRASQGMDVGSRRDVGVLDGSAGLLDNDVRTRRPVPAHAAEHVLSSQEQPLLQAGGHHGGEARAQVGAHRCRRRGVEYALEVPWPQILERDVCDDGQYEPRAVGRLVVAVPLRPATASGGTAT